MNKCISNCLLVLILLFKLSACDYQFSEDSYVELEVPSAGAKISLNEFNDKMIFTEPVQVSFSYDGAGVHRLYKISISINNRVVWSEGASSGTFLINTDELDEGEHSLKVDYIFSSGSGSLADLNGQEGYISTNEYSFSIVKHSPAKINIKKCEIVNGSVELNWDEVELDHIQEATLYIKSDRELIEQVVLNKEMLANQKYIDDKHIEKELRYSITTKSRYKEEIGNTISILIEEPMVSAEFIDESSYRLKWDEHPLFSNFEFYKTYLTRQQKLSPKGGELIINEAPVFGRNDWSSSETFYMYKHLKEENWDHEVNRFYADLTIGTPFEGMNGCWFIYDTELSAYFCTEYNNEPNDLNLYVHKLNEKFEKIQTVIISSERTRVDKFLIDPISKDYILDTEGKSYVIDPLTLKVKKEYSAQEFGETETYNATYYRNGFVIIDNLRDDEISFYKVDCKELVYQSTYRSEFYLSNDGKYFTKDTEVYNWDGSSAKLVFEMENLRSNFLATQFITDLNTMIYRDNENRFIQYDFTNNIKTPIENIKGRYFQYDQVTQTMICWERTSPNATLYVLDVNNLSYKTLQIYDDYNSFNYLLLNGRLIYTRGFYLDNYISK